MMKSAAFVFRLSAAALLLCRVPSAPAQDSAPSPAQVLQRLRPGHPRILCTEEDLARVKGLVVSDPTAIPP